MKPFQQGWNMAKSKCKLRENVMDLWGPVSALPAAVRAQTAQRKESFIGLEHHLHRNGNVSVIKPIKKIMLRVVLGSWIPFNWEKCFA